MGCHNLLFLLCWGMWGVGSLPLEGSAERPVTPSKQCSPTLKYTWDISQGCCALWKCSSSMPSRKTMRHLQDLLLHICNLFHTILKSNRWSSKSLQGSVGSTLFSCIFLLSFPSLVFDPSEGLAALWTVLLIQCFSSPLLRTWVLSPG